jgi:hypothetical protein
MFYLFARIGAAFGTMVDVYTRNRCLWVRLREKGVKRHSMPYSPQFRGIPHHLSELNRYLEKRPVSAPGRAVFVGELRDGA